MFCCTRQKPLWVADALAADESKELVQGGNDCTFVLPVGRFCQCSVHGNLFMLLKCPGARSGPIPLDSSLNDIAD